MICPSCGSENREGAGYCHSSGSRLSALMCSECGNDLAAGARFCDSCGEPVVAQTGPSASLGSALTPE